MDRNLSILVKFAALDRLTGPMRAIAAGSRKAGADLAATRKEIGQLNRASAQVKGFRDQEQKLQAVSKRLTNAKATLTELTAKMDAAVEPSERLAKGIAGAKAVVADLEIQLESGGSKLQALGEKLATTGISVENLAGGEESLAQRLHDANKRLAEQRAEMERVGAARDRMNASVERGEKLKSVGAGMIGVGAAIGAPLVAATNSAGDFQSKMTDIAQKANLTRGQADKLARTFDNIGPKIAQMPQALAEAYDQLVGLGAQNKQAQGMIQPIGRAATAYKAEMGDLANAGWAAVDNLKVGVNETGKMLDVMAQAGKAGAFEIKDMAQYFPALTASAQALGQKGVPAVADLAAALQITRKGAGDSATAANNLQNLLNKINTEDTVKNFKEMGIDLPAALKKAAKDSKSPIEAIAELASKATKGDLSKLSYLFGDAQVQAALRPLIQNLGAYRAIRADALKAQGTVERDFADRMKDANAQTAQFSARAVALGHRIGSILLPAVSSTMAVLGGMADRVSAWADAHPALVKGIVLTAAGLAILLVTLGSLAFVVGSILGPLAILRFGLTFLPGIALKVVGAFRLVAMVVRSLSFALPLLGMFGKALGLVATGFRILAAAVIANPIVAVAVGIGVAAYLIYTYWDLIKAAFTNGVARLGNAWIQLKAMFSAGMAWLGGLGPRFYQFGANLLQGLIRGITGALPALKSKIFGIVESVKKWFKDPLGIRSPSRVFAGFGGFLSEGLALGIERGAAAPIARAGELARKVAAAGALGLALPAIASSGSGAAPPRITAGPVDRLAATSQKVSQAIDAGSNTKTAASAPARTAAATPRAAPSVTFKIYGAPGQSAEDIARAVEKVLDRRDREQAAATRSEYRDDD